MIYQCQQGNYHILGEYGYTEIIKNEYGDKEIVSTGFINQAMPLIRYKTGDFVEESNFICDCGDPNKLVKEIKGRAEEIIHLSDGRRIGRLHDQIFKNVNHVKNGQIIYIFPDEFIFRVVPRDNFDNTNLDELHNIIKKLLGKNVRYNIEFVKSLNKKNKFKSVINIQN